MPTQVVTVVSAKGGVGKTTVAFALVAAALSKGLRVLAIDLDPNRGFTSVLAPSRSKLTVWDMIQKETTAEAVVRVIEMEGIPDDSVLALVPGDTRLETLTIPAQTLQELIDELLENEEYDVVIIDTQPHRPAFAAPMSVADRIIVPTDLDYLSISGAAFTIDSALKYGRVGSIGGLVVCNAKRPLSKVTTSLWKGLENFQLAYPTILWFNSGWVAARSGRPRMLDKNLLAKACQLYEDVIGGWSADKVSLQAFAGIAAQKGML